MKYALDDITLLCNLLDLFYVVYAIRCVIVGIDTLSIGVSVNLSKLQKLHKAHKKDMISFKLILTSVNLSNHFYF